MLAVAVEVIIIQVAQAEQEATVVAQMEQVMLALD
jgi:hypothetical protein